MTLLSALRKDERCQAKPFRKMEISGIMFLSLLLRMHGPVSITDITAFKPYIS